MKGGSIDPPDVAHALVDVAQGLDASMKGGSIDPPDGLGLVGAHRVTAASMKGGSIDPPDPKGGSEPDSRDMASMKGGSIDPPDGMVLGTSPVVWRWLQ